MKYTYSQIKNSFHAQEAWINVFFFKHITVPLTYFVTNHTRITPNVISIISLILGLGSAFFYLNGTLLLAGTMYFVSYVFDAIDGKVARITKTGKPYGAWFDIAVDRINLTLISLAISYRYYENNEDVSILIYNILFLAVSFIGSESRNQIDNYKLKHHYVQKEKREKSAYEEWCESKGVIKEPISLPEVFLFLLIASPQLGVEKITFVIVIVLLCLRLIKQQLFWIDVSKN